jgi:hypothetical protein
MIPIIPEELRRHRGATGRRVHDDRDYDNPFTAHGGWSRDGTLELWTGTIRHGDDVMHSGLQVVIRSDPHMFDIRQAAEKHGTADSY